MHILDVFAALTVVYLLYRLKTRTSGLPLPPGPKRFPLVGCALSIPNEYEWITYHMWSKELGSDILYLNRLGRNIIILNKAGVVNDLLDKRSSIYSSRSPFPFVVDVLGATFNFGLMKYGENWRQHRRLVQAYLGANIPSNYRPATVRAARNFLGKLLDDPKDIKAQLQYMAGDAILSICYGVDIRTKDGKYYLEAIHRGVAAIVAGLIPGKYLVDFIPALKYIPEWMPGAGFKQEARKLGKDISDMIKLPFRAAQRAAATGACPSCFSCKMIQATESEGKGVEFTQVIENVAGSLYGAGVDTTVSTIASCILGLLARPEVAQRAREDLDRVITPGHLPDFDDEPSLPYITAIVKEALRWREVVPLGLPHYIEVEDEYAGYRIPANSIVMANQWALLHDEEFYPDPFAFKPERFMKGDEYNHETKDPEYACWGFGRRICPGRYMAFSSIWITIASLIYAFDIEKDVDAYGSTIEPNPRYPSGLVSSPEPFSCHIKPRSDEFAKLVRAHINHDL